MKKITLILRFLGFIIEEPIARGATYYEDVIYEVKEVIEFSISGNSPALIIDSMEAGQPCTEVSDDSTTCSFVTNV